MRTNRVCKVCGTKYYYCASCDEAKAGKAGAEPWHILVHDENCFKIFDTLQRHFMKELNDKQAADVLRNCDLSVLQNALPNIRKQAEDILAAVEKMSVQKSKSKKVITEN